MKSKKKISHSLSILLRYLHKADDGMYEYSGIIWWSSGAKMIVCRYGV